METTYFVFINIFTFGIFGLDKARARTRSSRVPEAALIFLAFLGGALGGLLGMNIFRHKTRKAKFKIGMPIFLLFNLITIIYFLK